MVSKPNAYQYNGSITSSVSRGSNGRFYDRVAAYIDGEVRGIGSAAFFPPAGAWIFQTMIFSNAAAGETVEFKYENIATVR